MQATTNKITATEIINRLTEECVRITVEQGDPEEKLTVREFHARVMGRFEIALETFLEKFEAQNGEAEANRLRAAILAECEPTQK